MQYPHRLSTGFSQPHLLWTISLNIHLIMWISLQKPLHLWIYSDIISVFSLFTLNHITIVIHRCGYPVENS